MAESFLHNHQDDTSELLSGLLDEVLDQAEQTRATALIAECAGCRAEFADLRAMQQLLHELPLVQPPRSFTLDPHVYSKRRWSWAPLLRWGGAMAAVLVFVLVGVTALLPKGSAAPSMSSASQPETMQRSMNIPQSADSAASQGQAGAPVSPAGGQPQVAMASPAPAATMAAAEASTMASEFHQVTPETDTVYSSINPYSYPPPGNVAGGSQANPGDVSGAATTLAAQTAAKNQAFPTDVVRMTSPISGNQTDSLQPSAADPAQEQEADQKLVQQPSKSKLGTYGLLVLISLLAVAALSAKRRAD